MSLFIYQQIKLTSHCYCEQSPPIFWAILDLSLSLNLKLNEFIGRNNTEKKKPIFKVGVGAWFRALNPFMSGWVTGKKNRNCNWDDKELVLDTLASEVFPTTPALLWSNKLKLPFTAISTSAEYPDPPTPKKHEFL